MLRILICILHYLTVFVNNILFLLCTSSSVKKGNEQTKHASKIKTPLQTLHMTRENQKRVKELLCELQDQELASGTK